MHGEQISRSNAPSSNQQDCNRCHQSLIFPQFSCENKDSDSRRPEWPPGQASSWPLSPSGRPGPVPAVGQGPPSLFPPSPSTSLQGRGSQGTSIAFVFQQNAKGCVSILKEERPREVRMALNSENSPSCVSWPAYSHPSSAKQMSLSRPKIISSSKLPPLTVCRDKH